jgi:Mn-containing catalase
MFFHTKKLQYNAKPDKPDPIYAKQLQEVLGGQWGEISVMMNYLFQGWNCRGPAKYRDLLMDIGTEEIAHVEMLSTMIARLLEASPTEQEEAYNGGGVLGAIIGGTDPQQAIVEGMNPQHAIVSGLGATPSDSQGFPWTSRYIIASGNLMADFRFNVTAESQGRLQVTRLFGLTTDRGVRDMLSFMIARDAAHQNIWLAAIEDLEEEGLGDPLVPHTFPDDLQLEKVAFQHWSCSDGTDSKKGRWAKGETIDGRGKFEYVADPQPMGPKVDEAEPIDPRFHGTPKEPLEPVAS